jgi:threonine dehydrogenase-like Zn-dependent dehydrogenase
VKSLVWTKSEWMEIQQQPEPELLEDEVLVKVEAVGICGSEIEGYLGHNSLRVPPLVMGHEFCGKIHAIGKTVQDGLVGQKVVINPLLSCGKCILCRKGLVQLCKERKIVGIHRPGAFAEYVNVPASSVHPIPQEMDAYRIALTEPLACSLRAVRRAMEAYPFANVVVFGAGTIGLLSMLVAQILGASRIFIVDTNESRLKTPLKLGATAAFNPTDPNFVKKIKDATGLVGIDVVIDAAGYQSTRSAALEIINPGGTVMNIGLGIDNTQLQINACIRNEINILGSFTYQHQDFYSALEILKSGKINQAEWSEIRPLEDGQRAFQDLINGRMEKAKIFLTV